LFGIGTFKIRIVKKVLKQLETAEDTTAKAYQLLLGKIAEKENISLKLRK